MSSSKPRMNIRRFPVARMSILGSLMLLTACSVTPKTLTLNEQMQRVETDSQMLFADQEAVTKPITLYEATARALKYNLDQRLKLMETALATRNLTAANLDMLPSLTAQAGYDARDNYAGSSSRSLLTGQQSLESSTSTDKHLHDASIGITWNVLDFGLSYVRAQQVADQVLIAKERQRKVVHNITQDVRAAFWNAVSAERLLAQIEPLTIQVEDALAKVRRAQSRGIETPMNALKYRKELLDTLRQLKLMRRELNSARIQLATLMNLKPGTPYTLDPGNVDYQVPKIEINDIQRLERIALLNRPELHEETYQKRISEKDVRAAYLRMLPGVQINTAWNYDSNSYAWENNWFSWGGSISKNLFEVFTGPKRVDQAKTRAEVADYRRYAMSMAVMSQVHIALAAYSQSIDEFKTVSELYTVEQGIDKQIAANVRTGNAGQREAIRSKLQYLLAELRRDLAFADMRNAVGRIYLSLGADPVSGERNGDDIESIATAIESTTAPWFEGRINLPDGSEITPTLKADKNSAAVEQSTQEPPATES